MPTTTKAATVGIFDLLKASTANIHAQVEERVPVFEPQFDMKCYVELLERFYGFWASVEARLLGITEASDPRLRIVEKLAEQIDLCHSTCTGLELRVSALRLTQVRAGIESLGHLSGEAVAVAAENVQRELPLLIENELATHTFLAIIPSRKEYFDEPRKGFDEVIARFPDAVMDAEEMRKCFALSRYAGCVFHSVQVIEHGLIAIGAWLPGVNDPKAGWSSVTQELERIVILPFPKRTAFEQTHFVFIEQVNALMKAIKFAWRNKISHAGIKLHVLSPDFAPEIAEEIMIATRGFMRMLAVELP